MKKWITLFCLVLFTVYQVWSHTDQVKEEIISPSSVQILHYNALVDLYMAEELLQDKPAISYQYAKKARRECPGCIDIKSKSDKILARLGKRYRADSLATTKEVDVLEASVRSQRTWMRIGGGFFVFLLILTIVSISYNLRYSTENYELRLRGGDLEQDRQELLKESERLRNLRDTFVYRASHDLKGPLDRLRGLISLSELPGTGEKELHRYVEMMKDVVGSMNQSLLKLIEVHSLSQIKVNPVDISLKLVSEQVWGTLLKRNDMKVPELLVDIDTDTTICSDQQLISMILENLLENGIHFQQRTVVGTSWVKVKSSLVGNEIHLWVSDNGLGIVEEHRDQLFDMYFRGSVHSKGSGLGLYLVQWAVNRLKGRITILSEEDKGSCFYIVLPNMSAKSL